MDRHKAAQSYDIETYIIQLMLFSVIIPTCERTDTLRQVLDALASGKQTLAFENYEVIVTDDGRVEDAEALLKAEYPWVRFVKGPKAGPAANRNNGAKFATGEWLVFTDDDCLIDANWLYAYSQHTGGTAHAMEGSIEPIGEMNKVFCECPINTTGGLFWSANIAVKRNLFEQVGGFDANFLYPSQEDCDLRQRLLPLTEIIFVKESKVSHPIRVPNVQQMMGLTIKRCSAWTYFQGKHQNMTASPENYIRLVLGWMRVYWAYTKLNFKAKSIRGVYVSFLALFVLGPYAIFKTMFYSPEYKAFRTKRATAGQ
ncbi:MAG: glycosyltransferase family 2 protein [Candidatus Obscuribacterales bacterium]|nr:glycosyltransferase family 2 protein [Candidatus Obscuribacterales bacterium]